MTRTIRKLSLAEIGTLLEWAAAEGWNPGLHDAVTFQAADPNGFFGAFVDGTMVAAIAAVAYDQHFGFIGLYICHKDWRGRGHGRAVWDAGMEYLGERTIGLDGVPEQQANYQAMGFVAAYDTVRMSGSLIRDQSVASQVSTPARLAHIRSLDRQCFPAVRDGFLCYWISPPHRLLVIERSGKVDAYAVVRACRTGSKIGPLFATDVGAAITLLDTLEGPFQIDVPAAQTVWLEALSARDFTASFRTKRMYRGPTPSLELSQIFAISSLELG